MFKPDYRNISDCALNKKPARIPLYEHNISAEIMERITGSRFAHLLETDTAEFFRHYNNFFPAMGYDTVTFEACVTEILPFGGALAHPQPGYISDREKFESYPWDRLKDLFSAHFRKSLDALAANMPEGMKAIGGVGNGVFEIAQDLVGFENLCIMSFEDPELYAEIFAKIGDVLIGIWEWFLDNYADTYCVCRFGDDLGYKSNTMLSHADITAHIIPQYKRIISLIHSRGLPFLLHSCGCIFSVMDEIISEAGIDAKHSNEDQIADFSVWVERYGARIGNFGGIDTDHLVRMENGALAALTERIYRMAEAKDGGLAVGSGNSIPAYVDPEKYLVMVNTVRRLRGDEGF